MTDINLLKTFVEVSKTRHFSRAAENLFITSAAVSARVKLIEGQLGVQLFARHRGNMQLTSEGERLLPLAENMINTWDRTLREVSLQPELEGRIHIGATANLWLPPAHRKILELIEKKTDIAIQIEAHTNDTLIRFLQNRTLDIALLPGPSFQAGFRAEKIGELTLCLVADQKLTFRQAISTNYIYVDWGTAFAGFHARKIAEASTRVSVNMASIALNIIETQGGAAFLPNSVLSSTSLQIVEGAPKFKRPIYACFQEGNVRLSLIQDVVKILSGLLI